MADRTRLRLFVVCPEHAARSPRGGLEQGRRARRRSGSAVRRPAAELHHGETTAAGARRAPDAARAQVGLARRIQLDRAPAARPAASRPSSAPATAWTGTQITREVQWIREPVRPAPPRAGRAGRRGRERWPAAASPCSTSRRPAAPSSSTGWSEQLRGPRRASVAAREADLLAAGLDGADRADRASEADLVVEAPRRLRLVRVVQCARRGAARAARHPDRRRRHRAVRRRGARAGALLGMPDYRMVLVPHPVQLLTAAELDARADPALAAILASFRLDTFVVLTFRNLMSYAAPPFRPIEVRDRQRGAARRAPRQPAGAGAADRIARAHGLTMQQWELLARLRRAGGPVDQASCAAASASPRRRSRRSSTRPRSAAGSGAAPHPGDRRRRRVVLTAAGARADRVAAAPRPRGRTER